MPPIEEKICEERMEHQTGVFNLIVSRIDESLTELKASIKEMRGELKELNRTNTGFVPWEVFRDTCKEIEGLKKFIWAVSGGLSLAAILIGILARKL